jgi:ABC-2 type transport system permease protein
MPIFDQGYQHWHGQLSGHRWRWLTVARHGVRSQFQNRWPRLVLLLALVPGLILAAVMIVWGLFEQQASFLTPIIAMFQGLPEVLKTSPRSYRTTIWTLAFQYFFQVQMFFCMLLVVVVGQGLISQDLRFNAIPLYFSRPLRRIDYFLGKFGIIAVSLGAVAIAPVLLAYFLGLCFSMDLSVIRDTARLVAAAIGYGCVIVASAGTLMLAISALSKNSRYVGAIWIGLWIVTNAAAGVISEKETLDARWGSLVSYTANVKRVGEALLDTQSAWQQFGALAASTGSRSELATWTHPYPWYWSAGILAGIFGISLWILSLRVRTLDRLR